MTQSILIMYLVAVHKLETVNELEKVNLSHELTTSQLFLKENLEMGNMLLNDIQHLQSIPSNINWTKMKVRIFKLIRIIIYKSKII